MAIKTSTIECCFKKTVDMEMKKAEITKKHLQAAVLKCLLSHAPTTTATEPMTWRDGQTLVFVSNW